MVLFFGLIIVIILCKMNTPQHDFEKLKFSRFDLQNILLNNNKDLDGNFFTTNQFSDTNYFTIEGRNQNFLVVMTSPFQYFI